MNILLINNGKAGEYTKSSVFVHTKFMDMKIEFYYFRSEFDFTKTFKVTLGDSLWLQVLIQHFELYYCQA